MKSISQITFLVLGAVTFSNASALEWQNTPTVSVLSTSDDNYRLSTTDQRDVQSSRLDVSTELTGRSERVTFTVRPRVYAINFSDDRELDRTDAHLNTSLAVGNDRRQWNMSAGFTRDGTLANAFEETGFTEIDVDRDRATAGIGFSALTSERGTFAIQANAQQVRYEQLLAGALTDYDYASFALSYTYALSDRGDVAFSLYGSRLDTQQVLGEVNNTGFDLSFNRQLSETLDFRIGAGRYESDRPGAPVQTSDADTTADVSLAKRWSRWQARVGVSATTEPSAYGVLWRREGASIDISRQFGERVDAGLILSSVHIQSDEPLLFFEDRRYEYAQIRINWRVAEQLWFAASLGQREQKYYAQLPAEGTYGQLSFTYRGRGT